MRRIESRRARALAVVAALSVFHYPARAAGTERADILITAGTVITMDPDRRVINDGAVAIVVGHPPCRFD